MLLATYFLPLNSTTSIPVSTEQVNKLQNHKKTPVSKRKAAATSSRLCLKNQRSKNSEIDLVKKPQKEYNDSDDDDDDIVIVNEIKPSTSKLLNDKAEFSKSVESNNIESSSIECAKDSLKSNDTVNLRKTSLSPQSKNDNHTNEIRKETDIILTNQTSLKRKYSSQNESCDSNVLAETKSSTVNPKKQKKIRKSNSVSNNLKSKVSCKKDASKQIDALNLENNADTKKVKNNVTNDLHDKEIPQENNPNNNNEQNLDLTDILNDAKQISENDVFSELSDSEKKDTKPYTPYYIANFKYILESVIHEPDNQVLFNDEDHKSIKAFKAVSDAAQKFYVRLFQRKYKWLRINKINYPDIAKNPLTALEELVEAGLVDSGASEIELDTALGLLSLPEAKTLSKHFNFSSTKSKTEIKQMLLKHCKEHKSVFFTNGNNGVSGMMLKKVRNILGPCYRISLLPKRLFTRVLMLFSLPTISEDDDEAAGGQQQQLITLLQVNKGELVFPVCKRNKEAVIFCDRDELIRYEEARQLENDIYNAVESKNFELAKELYLNARKVFEEQSSCKFSKRSSSLPPFLKRYTSFHVYIRCMTQGVEALQRLRQYDEAVTLLKMLLKQKTYCQDYKGRWYDRLALNLEQHLKKREGAIKAIKQGLKDENVRVGHRYSLLTRALRITKSFDEEDEFKKQIIEESKVMEAPKVTIQGRLCPRSILGRRHVFVSSGVSAENEDDVTVLGVEEVALEHYKQQGYTEGIHGEGSTFQSLYALLFWDIIYDDTIPDVFISPYQTHPLDLNSQTFFPSRKDQIMNHLKHLRQCDNEELKDIVKSTWEAHHGKASLVSWDRFTDLQHVQGLACCFGSTILSGICERLAKDFRFTRSGVPDLVVWNPETLCVKIVEVKGPGDKLSSKQILWLDHLIKLGADAEVCLVEAVASKKLWK
ncbi:hypothetical protein JTE90_014444 [Oedothorax gibbosus]|uniref:Fanconi-associated nuclease n=1 Tax=Oedothorax gibbosus TaxID=931172 RepID=A0AAV6V3E8_9ARAC|nr:hypothetical protein JTE90_014444 [Oedothorax gibbosus]